MKEGVREEGADSIRGRFGRGRVFGGGSAVWLGVGALVITLVLMMRRQEKTSDGMRVAYRTTRERLGGPEQLKRHNTDFSSDQAGEFLVQEEDLMAETKGSPAEAEEGPGEEARGRTRESARRSEEGGGGEAESQGGESAAAVEESRSDSENYLSTNMFG
jgi:hypothetical protein